MKKRVLLLASALFLFAAASARQAQAQQSLVVDIPFEFVAGHATLPAGEYYVQSASSGSDITLIRRGDSRASAMVLSMATETLNPQSKSKLIFNQYGNRYFLSQFWIEGSRRGRALPTTAREKEAAQVVAQEARGQVTLVARLASPNQ